MGQCSNWEIKPLKKVNTLILFAFSNNKRKVAESDMALPFHLCETSN